MGRFKGLGGEQSWSRSKRAFFWLHCELFRLMVDEGKSSEGRMRWLVDTHADFVARLLVP